VAGNTNLESLVNVAKSFISHGPPKSDLAKLLINLNNLHKALKLSKPQKDALKTLALRSDKTLLAASQVYETDKDESEFVDTLQKISHLAFL